MCRLCLRFAERDVNGASAFVLTVRTKKEDFDMFTVQVDLTNTEEALVRRYAQAQGKTVEELFKTALFEKISL